MSLRDSIRAYLGTDTLQRIEDLMANEILTLLQGLAQQTTELTAVQQASIVNIHNALNRQSEAIADLTQRLNQAVEGNGKVTPEMQDAANAISGALADLKKAAETADNGYEPAGDPTDEEPGTDVPATDVPATPGTPEVPAEPTDTTGPTPDQPADTPQVPATGDVPTDGTDEVTARRTRR